MKRLPHSEALAQLESNVNPATGWIRSVSATQGYHTALPTGTPIHPTRENVRFAHALILSDQPGHNEKGLKILKQVLDTQVTDSTDRWYGIWGWYFEEPPSQMSPADWNWADFIGATLIDLYLDAKDRLPGDIQERVLEAIGHASWSIFRRNVGPGYTNIAAMGSAVTMAAGRLLEEPRLLDYGRQRLSNLQRHVQVHNGFGEYNSPTYTLVLIEEFERILALVPDAEVQKQAEALRRLAWKLTADHFHPPTQQWAGPHSRAYGDRLGGFQIPFLSKRLGFELTAHPTVSGLSPQLGLDHPLPCPEDLRDRFRNLPFNTEYEHRHVWSRRKDGSDQTVSTTWFSPEATLGSINQEITWEQPHPIVGYWKTPEEPSARLRVRVLFNGRDFAAGQLLTTQKGPTLLSVAQFLGGEGTYHPHFDKPGKSPYRLNDLRIRVQVQGKGAKIKRTKAGEDDLIVGEGRIRLTVGPARFEGIETIPREVYAEEGMVWVDCILYSGPTRDWNPGESLDTFHAVGLEWLPGESETEPVKIQWMEDDGARIFSWKQDLKIVARQPAVRGNV